MRAVLIALTLWLMAWTPAGADQRDPRLDELFAELRAADRLESRAIELRIWAIWSEHADPMASAMLEEARIAMAGRNQDAARDVLDRLIAIQPAFAEAWNQRATLRWLANDPIGSLADIRQTLALEPRHFGALAGMGLILMAENRDIAAARAFEAALAVAPWLPGARQNLEIIRARAQGQSL